MPLHRQKKFVRSAEPPANLSITPRDYELLRDIAEYRFMNTEQILALYPTSPRNIRLRLSKLFDAHFLDRPESQRYAPREKQFLIYSLGEKGKELLSRNESVHKNKEVGFPYLAHAMMISRFHATLTLEPLREWLKDATTLGEITLSPELLPKKSSAQKIFGSNLFLKNRKVEFVPETQYAALCAAYGKIGKFPLNEILVEHIEPIGKLFARLVKDIYQALLGLSQSSLLTSGMI